MATRSYRSKQGRLPAFVAGTAEWFISQSKEPDQHEPCSLQKKNLQYDKKANYV